MATNAIKLISAEAKKIQKANPKLKWMECIKKASANYRARGTKPAKRSVKQRATKQPVKSGSIKMRKPSTRKKVAGESLGSIFAKGKKVLEDKLGKTEVKLFNAKKKSDKNKLLKQKAEIKRHLRKINYGGNIKLS